MPVTSHAQILRFHAAAVTLGFSASRNVLLAGIPESLTAGIPTVADRSAQLLGDLNRLNDIGELPDGSVPLRSWLDNAQALSGPRRGAAVFKEPFEGPPGGKPGRLALGIGASVLIALIALALALHFGKSSETTGTAPGASGSAPLPATAAPPPGDSAGPAGTTPLPVAPSPSGTAARPRFASSGVSPPPASSPSAVAPPACKSGTASLKGAFWSLGIPRQELGAAQFVYLDPSPRPEALSGVQPTCSLLAGTGTAQCSRSDNALAVSIGNSAPWRAPCP